MGKYFKWEGAISDRKFLLRTIADFRKVKDGKVSFDAFEYHYWRPVLNSAVRASPEVSSLKDACIRKVLSDANLDLGSEVDFLDRCDSHFASLMKNEKKNYLLLCSITYAGEKLLNRLTDGPAVIWQPSVTSKIYKRALSSRKELDGLIDRSGVAEPKWPLTPLFIKVSAVDIWHAFNLAIDAADKFRGILNLMVNANRSVPIFGFPRRHHAVNRFRLGPVETLHKLDGTLAAQTFWYEPRWVHEAEDAKFAGTPEKVREEILAFWRKATGGDLRNHITTGLLRYCRSLDRHDSDAALIGLWSALEFLTGTSNYDLVVSRIAKLFSDDHVARIVADHVRIRRNATVHAASAPEGEEAEMVLLHADTLVRRALYFCIVDGNKFRQTRDLFEFMDMNPNLRDLTRHRKLVDQFIKYREHLKRPKKGKKPP